MQKKQKRAGRPAFYRKPEDMQIKIDEYFKSCEGELLRNDSGEIILDKNDRPVYIGRRVPSLTALAHYLGFTDRRAFIRYKRKPEFVDTVLQARLRVEEALEELLFERKSAEGAMFALVSKFGWSYKSKQYKEPLAVQIINQPMRKKAAASCDPAQPAADTPISEERKSNPVSC